MYLSEFLAASWENKWVDVVWSSVLQKIFWAISQGQQECAYNYVWIVMKRENWRAIFSGSPIHNGSLWHLVSKVIHMYRIKIKISIVKIWRQKNNKNLIWKILHDI